MKVICIDGCHGVGKTAIIADIAKRGYHVLDELFFEMPKFLVPSQSLTVEFIWISNWFKRILDMQKAGMADDAIVFADRSPFSAVFYSRASPEDRLALEKVIRGMIAELSRYNITIHTVGLLVEREELWKRVQRRLETEPFRREFNEDKRWWLDQTADWYESFGWDTVIDNSSQRSSIAGLSTLISPFMRDVCGINWD